MITPQHTIFNVCKYKSSGTKRVILQADRYYATFGFIQVLQVLVMKDHGLHIQMVEKHSGMIMFYHLKEWI